MDENKNKVLIITGIKSIIGSVEQTNNIKEITTLIPKGEE